MISKRKINMLSLTILCIVSLLYSTLCFGANFPLEIINIKPAGTGNPAIPATHRIFRAYPGIDYNIRAAVIGGLYPYTFKLSNAPTGMTINSSTGEIDWPNPQANSGAITLSVTDSEGTTVTSNWSITVTTNGFYFVDPSKTINGTGSISSPFNSLANMVAGTGSSHLTDIVYLRGGTYLLAHDGISGDGVTYQMNFTNNSPFTWLGYPGEIVNIIGNMSQIRTYRVYYDSLNFSGFTNHAIEGQGITDYQTIRRCSFSDLTAINSTNQNQGFIYTNSSGTVGTQGYGFVIQDNQLSNYTGGCAIGSLYSMNKSLIEDNYIYNSGGGGVTGIQSAIAPKEDCDRLTIRHNRVVPGKGYILGNSMNSIMAYTDNMEVCFNYFNIGSSNLAHAFFERVDKPQTNLYYYRNTLVGYLGFDRIDGSSCVTTGTAVPLGTIKVNNNVMVQSTGNVADWGVSPINGLAYLPWAGFSINTPQNCVTSTNNLIGLPSANLIDIDGNLTTTYQSLIGSIGWQTTPPNPTNLQALTLKLIKVTP